MRIGRTANICSFMEKPTIVEIIIQITDSIATNSSGNINTEMGNAKRSIIFIKVGNR